MIAQYLLHQLGCPISAASLSATSPLSTEEEVGFLQTFAAEAGPPTDPVDSHWVMGHLRNL